MKLNIRYTGELHDVRLINFSAEKEEIAPLLPKGLEPRFINDRVFISMVDVKLRNMRPHFMPSWFRFHYRHIAFGLMIDDSRYSNDYKGIFFLRSFTSNPLIAWAGSLLTNYRLGLASIREDADGLHLRQGKNFLHYQLSDTQVVEKSPWLKQQVANLDRAYARNGNTMEVTQIQREKWPIQWTKCTEFETSFFKTARLECAFRVHETIDYQWLPPKTLPL
jgi:hypothetical protein